MLLQGGLNIKGMQTREAINKVNNQSFQDRTKAQQESRNQKLISDNAFREYKRKLDLIKFNTSLSQDARDAQLAQAKFDYLKSKPIDPGSDLLEDENGQLVRVPKGSYIPEGYKKPTTRNIELTEQQKFTQGGKIAQWAGWVDAELDKHGGEVKDPQIKPYIDMINSNPNAPYMYIESKSEPFKIFGKDVPKTGGKTIYKKVPRVDDATLNFSTQENNTQQFTPAPPEAVEYLLAHPEAAADFKAKYGYLPEGM